jgi:hypothetical protein
MAPVACADDGGYSRFGSSPEFGFFLHFVMRPNPGRQNRRKAFENWSIPPRIVYQVDVLLNSPVDGISDSPFITPSFAVKYLTSDKANAWRNASIFPSVASNYPGYMCSMAIQVGNVVFGPFIGEVSTEGQIDPSFQIGMSGIDPAIDNRHRYPLAR